MKIYLPILLSILGLSIVDAENVSRFPLKSTSKWIVNYEVMDADTMHIDGDEKLTFYIENDTVINTSTFFKLYKSGTAYYDPPFLFDHVYLGAIRDEDNRIYFIEKGHSNEVVLYDFNLNEGDTIHSTIENGMEVTSIETLNNSRIKINFHKTDFLHGECSNMFNTYLIEGVGSMGGILYESPCNHIGFREHYLVCYSENDEVVYQNTLSPYSCENTSVNFDSYNQINLSIYPNPAVNKLTVILYSESVKEGICNIYNISGSLIISKNIEANSRIDIDTKGFVSGIYLLRITYSTACLTRKFIIE